MRSPFTSVPWCESRSRSRETPSVVSITQCVRLTDREESTTSLDEERPMVTWPSSTVSPGAIVTIGITALISSRWSPLTREVTCACVPRGMA